MLGQGIMPQQHHQRADLMGDEELGHCLGSIRDGIVKTVAQLPRSIRLTCRLTAAPSLSASLSGLTWTP